MISLRRAISASTFASMALRPMSGSSSPAPMLQIVAGPLNRFFSAADSEPSRPVSEIDGN
jgi:hypothetical protein